MQTGQLALLRGKRELTHRLGDRPPLLDGEFPLEIDEAIGADGSILVGLVEAQGRVKFSLLPGNERCDDAGDLGFVGVNQRRVG